MADKKETGPVGDEGQSNASDGGKVIDLTQKRQRKKPESSDEKVSIRDRQKEIALVINGYHDTIGMPAFLSKFYVLERKPGVRTVLKDDGSGTVSHVSESAVTQAIVEYTSALPPNKNFYMWQVAQCEKAKDYWLAYTKPIAMPKMVAWKDDPALTFSRLPWIKGDGSDSTPLFDELFSRVKNAEALKHWIASLFYPQADRQQYVWMFGDGGDGKGALSRFILKVFGFESSCSPQPPRPNDAHWMTKLIGKRFVLFADCNDVKFPASGFFKTLTGDDPVNVNPKFKEEFTAHLMAKFMFLSNEVPVLSGEKADQRRPILCETMPLPPGVKPSRHYEDNLWKEGGAFLSKILRDYAIAYPDHGPIAADADGLAEITSIAEERYEALCGRFTFGDAYRCKPVDFDRVVRDTFSKDVERTEFRKYLKRTHGVVKKKIKEGGKAIWYYVGCQLNGPIDREWQPKG